MSYELYIPPKWNGKNAKTGRFLKGHIPANKGKKWGEWMGKRAKKRAAKGWKNLELHRPKNRPDNAGRCAKAVIAVDDEGRWCFFPNLVKAGEWIGGNRENVGRCCRLNSARKVLEKPVGKVNTDHKYKGIRFYFESDDDIWTTKTKGQ